MFYAWLWQQCLSYPGYQVGELNNQTYELLGDPTRMIPDNGRFLFLL